jgi:hypothetical protein
MVLITPANFGVLWLCGVQVSPSHIFSVFPAIGSIPAESSVDISVKFEGLTVLQARRIPGYIRLRTALGTAGCIFPHLLFARDGMSDVQRWSH